MDCDTIQAQGNAAGIGDRILCALLYPGTLACDLFGVRDPDGRMILRMFVNLSVYSKLAVLIAFLMI